MVPAVVVSAGKDGDIAGVVRSRPFEVNRRNRALILLVRRLGFRGLLGCLAIKRLCQKAPAAKARLKIGAIQADGKNDVAPISVPIAQRPRVFLTKPKDRAFLGSGRLEPACEGPAGSAIIIGERDARLDPEVALT